ncbi:MAG: hypothetical protein KKA43_05325, partial [Nanoarchaeota archaeon]|nr:hypothetical protein [Nanoarchaeota archaeon]
MPLFRVKKQKPAYDSVVHKYDELRDYLISGIVYLMKDASPPPHQALGYANLVDGDVVRVGSL